MSEEHPAESEAIVPRVATFFAIYPEPLGLADGQYFCTVTKEQIAGFPSEIALHLKDGERTIWLNPLFHESLFVSVRFHRGIHLQNLVGKHIRDLVTVVRAVGGTSLPALDTGVDEQAANDEATLGKDWYTVVEMTTPVVWSHGTHWEPCMPTDTIMGPTLTRCFDGLMRVINAYRLSQKILIPAPARERVGPTVISLTRRANPGQNGWDVPAREVINFFATYRWPSARDDENTFVSDAMSTYIMYETIGHPITALASVQAEMDTALYCEGNFRAVVMSTHTAGEVLVDIALAGMLYEEGKSIDEALAVFSSPLKTRILNEYHDRLGGSWNTKGAHAVAVWLRDLLSLRHRVAHAGYMPSYDEAVAAREAHYALGTHLRDRLAAKARKYPFTAGMLVTAGGFERRNIQTRAAREAVEAAGVDAVRKFTPWRAELMLKRV
jgi:hypothetical protein